MNIFGLSLIQIFSVIIFLLVGGFVVWKIFRAVLHIAIFVIAVLILVYIYNHVPTIHQIVLNCI